MKNLFGSAALLAISASAGTAAAPAAAPIDSRATIAEVRRIIAANYVIPGLRPKLDAALAEGLQAGRYDVADPIQLDDRINADLAAVAHDKHLSIHFDSAEAARLAANPPKPGADDAPPSEDEITHAAKFNHGIDELKVLTGNIRYIDVMGFFWGGARTAAAYDNAMTFLKGGDAVIIDLRHNGGGDPKAVRYMISHFLPPSRPLVTFYVGSKKPDHYTSLASLPAGRLVGKPLYVLTSGQTASAAEEFTGHVAGYKLGEIVGGNTAGAGFNNQFFPVAGGHVLSVSIGRAILASTGKDWEGIGIAPTVKADPDKALEVAQVAALRRIAQAPAAINKRLLEARADLLEAQFGAKPAALPLDRYAGTYGERTVTFGSGKLFFQRHGGQRLTLVPLGGNLFTFEQDPISRLQFTVASQTVTGFEFLRSDGMKVDAQRTP